MINYDKNKLKAEMEKIAKEIDVDVKDATLDISGEKLKLYQILMVLKWIFLRVWRILIIKLRKVTIKMS